MKLFQLGVLLVTAPWWVSVARRIAQEVWRSAGDTSHGNRPAPPPRGVVRRFEFDTSSLRSGWDEEFGRERRLVNEAWLTGHRPSRVRSAGLLLESPTERAWRSPRRR